MQLRPRRRRRRTDFKRRGRAESWRREGGRSPATPLGLTSRGWYRIEVIYPREQLLAALQHAAGKQGDSSSSSGSKLFSLSEKSEKKLAEAASLGSVSESGVAESLEPIKMSSGGDLRDFGTLALDNKQPARMTLRSMRDEPLPLRLFWSNKSGGEKQVSSDRSGSSTVEGHHVVLSTLEASGSATAAASKDELVQALHVLLPPRGTVIVIVQAVLAEGYGPGGAGGRPHAGKMLTDTSGLLGGAIPFGRVAITPTNTRGGEGTRYLDAVERGSASARAPQAHASAVQLLWLPPPPAAATLRLEPPDLAFNNVLVGVAAEVAPSAKFEIVNTGQTEMNFMLMLRREERRAQ